MSDKRILAKDLEPGDVVLVDGQGYSRFKFVQMDDSGAVRFHEVDRAGHYQRVRFLRPESKCKKVSRR